MEGQVSLSAPRVHISSSFLVYFDSLHKTTFNPIRTGGCFPPGSRFFANNFGSNKGIRSKLSDFS